jgi:riboflavin transporter FmnP
MNTTTKNAQKIRRMVVIGMFAAMAYVAMLAIHIKVSFLTLDVKDALITICGLYFGPLSALFISALVGLLEFATVSSTGVYGLIMNVLGSAAFSVTASSIYKWKKNLHAAFLGLACAVCVTTGVMLLANLLITPYFMGVEVSTVKQMIPTLFLPFNFIKTVLNVGLVLLLYKHIGNALRRAGFSPRKKAAVVEGDADAESAKKRALVRNISVFSVAVVLIAVSAIVIFVTLGGKISFGK